MFTVFTPEGEDPYTRSVTTLLEGRDGTIWCGTRRGLFRLAQTDRRRALILVDVGLPTDYPLSGLIDALVEDRHGTLWVGAATGLYRRWPDGTTARYSTQDGLPDENLHDLLEDRLGNLWVATRLGGLFRLATTAGHERPIITRAYNHKNALMSDWVFDLHESSDGRLWAGTNYGLVEFPLGDESQRGPSHVYTEKRLHLSRDHECDGRPGGQPLAWLDQRRNEGRPQRLSHLW
ncbi:MAG TPA: two-component regulator propeller domain-containing protein [Pyrinomonadaceae bacterium]|nr:two-component regulator propeller domain-containing protein [Pyrinomonadaceae bacterium]